MLDGVLLIHKPKGMTSHDVINILRKRYHQKKFGHTGTLDPMAEGVLVILCGKATKTLQFLSDTDKEYIAQIQLGTFTTTDDIYGDILETKEINMDFHFQEVLDTFKGKIHQLVPMTSNKKVNGMKLLDYQRKGLEVPKVYQDIEIYDIQAMDPLQFSVHCSSGTYVRSICRDFGFKTNNASCMQSLIRTKVGRFTLDQCQTLEQLENQEPVLYSTKLVLDHYPMIELENIEPVVQGKTIDLDCQEPIVCITYQDQPFAIYEKCEQGYRSKRGLW